MDTPVERSPLRDEIEGTRIGIAVARRDVLRLSTALTADGRHKHVEPLRRLHGLLVEASSLFDDTMRATADEGASLLVDTLREHPREEA